MKRKFSMGMELMGEVKVALTALFVMIVIGTVAYHQIEEWSWVSSFYFTVATLTTVGYGDLYPTSELSRLFTACFALAGVTIALGSIGIIGSTYLKKRDELMRCVLAEQTNQKG